MNSMRHIKRNKSESSAFEDITFDPFFGFNSKTLNWAPSIRYLLRRNRLVKIIDQFPKGKLLEIGCATAALLSELSQRGFDCTGVETSTQAFEIAKNLSKSLSPAPYITSNMETLQNSIFDIICAFDVLEHIEKDSEALAFWISKLKSGGNLIITVPAHRSRWSSGDVWAGHYRRYDREDLLNLVKKLGLHTTHFECYGFPLANLTEWAGRIAYSKAIKGAHDTTSKTSATANSGIKRNFYQKTFVLLNNPFGKLFLKMAYLIQNITKNTNLGSGYILVAKKI